jgi:hypothetical protein
MIALIEAADNLDRQLRTLLDARALLVEATIALAKAAEELAEEEALTIESLIDIQDRCRYLRVDLAAPTLNDVNFGGASKSDALSFVNIDLPEQEGRELVDLVGFLAPRLTPAAA